MPQPMPPLVATETYLPNAQQQSWPTYQQVFSPLS
jgi:hypothetical protein